LSEISSSYLLHDTSLLLIKAAHGLANVYSDKMLQNVTNAEVVDKLIKSGHIDSAYHESIEMYKEALIDNDSLFIAISGIALGKSSGSIGFSTIAIDILEESKEFFARTEDKTNLAIAWEELGAIYYRLGQFEKSNTFLDKLHNHALRENNILLFA